MRAYAKPTKNAGFTLIEVMVALAITALVMTLLMGATYYVLQVRVKLANEVSQGELQVRRQLWFKQVVASLQPVEREASDSFDGNEKGFQGLAVQSLRAESDGAPEMVALNIGRSEQGATTLTYQAGSKPILLASWPNAKAVFMYQNQAGRLEPSWDAAHQATERIPRAIELRVTDRDTDALLDYWFARVEAEPWLRQSAPAPFLPPGGS